MIVWADLMLLATPRAVTRANAWRWEYPHADTRNLSPAERAAERIALAEEKTGKPSRRQFERMKDYKRRTGVPGHAAELAHAVEEELRRRAHIRSTRSYGCHMVSLAAHYFFQGNRRAAKWTGYSERTARRARRRLEDAGLIRSYLVLPGQRVPGMKRAVTRPQVVRDITPLLRLARARSGGRIPRHEMYAGARATVRGASVHKGAGVPPHQTAASTEAPRAPSAAELFDEAQHLEQLAQQSPEWLRTTLAMVAAAKRQSAEPRKPPQARKEPKPPPNAAPLMTDEEIDAVERELLGIDPPARPPPLS